jgi:hypothetical protein
VLDAISSARIAKQERPRALFAVADRATGRLVVELLLKALRRGFPLRHLFQPALAAFRHGKALPLSSHLALVITI